ncbi:MAG: tetratricopeptide repeat protein, partial [Pyrinomonadaceae bacterium]|nr:tetratricopeptide repeat protein [Pyrinomonadaceae bacterium]
NSANSNNANAGNSSNTKTANSKATNGNSELGAIPNAEVPTYTSASDALAEGNKFLDAGEEEKAVNAFQQAFKLDPNPAEAHFQLAVAYENLAVEADDTKPDPKADSKKEEYKKKAEKSFAEAVKDYQKLAAKNPKDATVHYNLGRALSKSNEDEKAEKALGQAVKLQPKDAEYTFEYGLILIKLAKYDKAIASLRAAQKLDPDNLRIEAALDKALAGKKRVDAGKTDKTKQPKTAPVQQKTNRQ